MPNRVGQNWSMANTEPQTVADMTAKQWLLLGAFAFAVNVVVSRLFSHAFDDAPEAWSDTLMRSALLSLWLVFWLTWGLERWKRRRAQRQARRCEQRVCGLVASAADQASRS